MYELANIIISPSVLALPDGAEHEFKLLQHSLDYDRDAMRMSDLDGLNLNICVPAGRNVPVNGSLPVFAFIHGGGFVGGSSSFPPYETTRIVRLSVAKGMPVIAVSLK